ncbi:MAG: biotin/lipoyl-containing protein, partial [Actinomycetota bacterium]
MATPVTMPQLGETVVEGTIVKWLKGKGDTVERDEPLFEISTDKVDTEVPSPVAGTITEIKVPEGETVSVGTELALIEESGSGGGGGETKQAEPAAKEDAPASTAGGNGDGQTAPAPKTEAPATPAPVPAPAPQPVAASVAAPTRGPRSHILSP